MRKQLKASVVLAWFLVTLGWAFSADQHERAFAGPTPRITKDAQDPSDHVPIGDLECVECHDEIIKKAYVHPAAPGGCTICHDYTETDKGPQISLSAGSPDLCFACHADKQENLASKAFKHPPAEGDCTLCHNPHSSDHPRLLPAETTTLCLMCHSDRQADLDKKYVHPPLKEWGCAVCHNPHASDHAPMLAAEINDVCLACHKMSPENYRGNSKAVVLGGYTIPAEYANRARKIVLGRDNRGHPYIGHPVDGVADPSEKDTKMSCGSCHDPHAGNQAKMLKNDLKGQALCNRCHS